MKKLSIVLLVAITALATALPTPAQAVATTETDVRPASIQRTLVDGNPDFNYLKNYLKNPQVLGSRKVNLTGTLRKVEEAEKSKLIGNEDQAKALLLETIGRVRKLSEKGRLEPVYARHYQQQVNILIASWSAPVPRKNGGYPDIWNNAPIDSIIDSWGMYNRESVSYAAFRVADSGRYMPYWGGRGNPNQWPGNALAAGIPVDTTPKVGDVVILNIGVYGHAAYVEEVMPDGSVRVSQYSGPFGLYSELIIAAYATSDIYIHFPYDDSN